jgi:hypothetical protein
MIAANRYLETYMYSGANRYWCMTVRVIRRIG